MNNWQIEMANIIDDISRNLVSKHGPNNRGILTLSDFHLNATTFCVFVGKEDCIKYARVLPNDLENADRMEDLKYSPPLEKRCEGVEIFIKSGKVTTKMLYPEDIDRERDDFELRDAVVHSYFGEGKIVYPPMPKGIWDQYTG